MDLIQRRRELLKMGGGDPFANWVKIKTKNYGTNKNCFLCNVSYVSRMAVDGVEVTPSQYYDFGDSDYHIVHLLYNDPITIPESGVYQDNYTSIAKDIPAIYTSFGNSALRGSGSSGICAVAIRATTMPSFGLYNWRGWTRGTLYVPTELIEDYKALTGWADNKVRPLSEFVF